MTYRGYIIKRLIQAIPAVLVIIVANFVLINIAPGDPALYLLGWGWHGDQAALEEVRISYGLDKPILERLGIYLTHVFRGDLGKSYNYRMPVLDMILERLPNTLILVGTAFAFSLLVGVFWGAYSSKKHPGKIDSFFSTLSLGFYSLPPFWVGLVLLLFFSLSLRWFPTQGFVTPSIGGGVPYVLSSLHHLFLPALTLFLTTYPAFFLLTRSSMIEIKEDDYITTAKAAGLRENTIFFKHALKNALMPTVSGATLLFGMLLFGSVLVETVFGWPGLGLLLRDAAMGRDYPLIMGIFIISSIWFVLVNIVADLLYAYLDPRVTL